MDKKYEPEDYLNKWLGFIMTECQDTRYLNQYRDDLIDDLCSLLFSADVSYEDAKFLKKQVMFALTTEEGRKGAGKHKGWKETVLESYSAILANYYVKRVEVDESKDNRVKSKKDKVIEEVDRYHPDNILITNWAKDKWGEDWTPALNRESHLVFGSLNLSFQREVFESDWINEKDLYPKWFSLALTSISI